MALRQIDGYWYIDVRHKGRRVRQSTGVEISKVGSKKTAQEYHDKVKHDLWSQSKLGAKPDRSWRQAVVKWLQENEDKKSLKTDKQRLRVLDQWLGEKLLREIDSDLVSKIKRERKRQKKIVYRGPDKPHKITNQTVSIAEVNRALALLRSILNAAIGWNWIDRAPKVKLFKESKGHIRWLTSEEADRLLAELQPHLKSIAAFTLETGLRDQNVTKLKWSQVNLASKLVSVMVKGDKSLSVPLNENALRILRELRFQHPEYVFTYKGHPLARPNNSGWKSALRRAQISNFRWHDLRHTWASWHVQGGTNLYTLKQLGGWEDINMVMRYAHLAPENLAAAQKMLESRAGFGQAEPDKELDKNA